MERGLEVKRIGNLIMEVIGGRAIHPVNVKVGGFYRTPASRELRELRAELDRGLELATEVVGWVAALRTGSVPIPVVWCVHVDPVSVLFQTPVSAPT